MVNGHMEARFQSSFRIRTGILASQPAVTVTGLNLVTKFVASIQRRPRQGKKNYSTRKQIINCYNVKNFRAEDSKVEVTGTEPGDPGGL